MSIDWSGRGETLKDTGRFRSRIRDEVAQEFDFHLEMRIAELVSRGWTSEAARVEALRRFGDVELSREVCVSEDYEGTVRRRRRRYLDELRQDVRQGARQLRRKPLLAAVATCTLALGIGANTALFSVADHVLLRPLPYVEVDRVVAVWKSDARTGEARQGVSPGDFGDWRERSTHFAAWGLAEPTGYDETGGERPTPLEAWRVTEGYFDALGVTPIIGRLFTPAEHDDAVGPVILGFSYWQRRFGGDVSVVGQTVELDGVARTIVGVLPADAEYPDARAVWTPWRLSESDLRDRRTSHMFAVARLADGVTLDAARTELASISTQLAAEYPATNPATAAALVPFEEQVLGPVRPALLVLLGAVGLVLLIACANVSGLLLARNAERSRELALRAALGAGRRRLVHQLLVESAALAVVGGLMGVLVAWVALTVFHNSAPADLPRAGNVGIDGRVLLFTTSLTIFAALLFGLLPALRASVADPDRALRGGGRTGTASLSQDRAQRVVVMAEVSIAFVLVVGAGLLARSFVTLLGNDIGFATEGRVLLQAHLWDANPTAEQRIQRAEEIEMSLASAPGVVATGITTAAPFHPVRIDPQSTLVVHGEPEPRPGEERRVVTILASPGYFDAFGIDLVRGRVFERFDRMGAPRVAVLNESAARLFFPGVDPIGQRIRVGVFGAPQEREVVGVVRDTRPAGLESVAQPEAFIPFAQHGFGSVTWVVRVDGSAAAALPELHERVWAAQPQFVRNLPHRLYDIRDMNVQFHSQQLGAPADLVPVHGGGEGAVLHLLLHALRRQVIDAGRPYQRARGDEAGQLVAREQGPVELGFRRDAGEVVTVREDRVQHLVGVAALAQRLDRAERVFVGVLLPVEVVEQACECPAFLVVAASACVVAHGRLDGTHVVAQPLVVHPLAQQRERVVACRHGVSRIGSGRARRAPGADNRGRAAGVNARRARSRS
jgi:putative ABC transport system permease protein